MRRPREVTEAKTEHDRAPGAASTPHTVRDPVDETDERGVDVLERFPRAAEGALRPDRATAPARLHRPRIAVVSERVQVPAPRTS